MKSISKFTLQIECTRNSCETNHFGEHLNKWQNYVCNVHCATHSKRRFGCMQHWKSWRNTFSSLFRLFNIASFHPVLDCWVAKKRLGTLRLWKFLSHAQWKTVKLHCSGIAYIVCHSLTRYYLHIDLNRHYLYSNICLPCFHNIQVFKSI